MELMTIDLSHDFETSSWPAVLENHRSWLSSIVYARVRNREGVEEVLQETALAAVKKDLRAEDANGVFRWLYRVAVRQAVLYLRNRSRTTNRIHNVASQNQESATEKANSGDPIRILISLENRELVQLAMEKLTSRDREILLLKYCNEWSCAEVGERFGASTSAIKSRLLRARKNLRSELLKLDENW